MKNLVKYIISVVLLAVSVSMVSAAEKQITVWAMGYEGTKIGEMARIFEKENPGVKVITQPIPWSAAHAKLLTSVVGGVPPDVSQMGTTWVAEFQAMNAFEPLDNYLKNSDVRENDFFKSSFKIGKIDEKIYGIPWYVDTRVLFYRKDLLSEVGLNRAPETWEEFLEVATKLALDTDGDGKVDRYGVALPVKDWQVFLPFLWQNDGGILNESHSEIIVKEDSFAETIKFYVKFYAGNAAPLEDPGYDLLWAFKEGIYPMFISGPWMVDIIRKQLPEIEGNWGVALLPRGKNHTSFVGGSHLVVFRDSPNKDIAWKFVEFMSRPENQLKWFEITGGLPANRLSWESGYFSDKPFIKVFGDQMLHTKAPPNIPQWEEIASFINKRLEEVLLKRSSISEMQESLHRDISSVLIKKEVGSRNVIVWFLVITLGGAALLFLYVKRLGLKERQVSLSLGKKEVVEREPPGGLPGKGWKVNYIPYIFIFPAIITLLVFLFFPIFSSFMISLTNWNIHSFADLSNLRFIGATNYLSLFGDKIFWRAMLNTLVFSCVGIPLNIIIALSLAVIIDKKFIKSKAIFRGGYFMPVITTLVAVAVVWRWLYNPEYGLINYLLGFLGIEKQTWLSNPVLALPSLIIMSVWKNFGYNMVIILAGLQTIPNSLYEAAEVDGADAWQSFWNITLPSLRSTLFFVVVMTTIGSFQFFAEPYIMTEGGPLNRTLSTVMYMYNQGFKFYNFGYASAIAYMLFISILMFTVVQMLYRRGLEAR